MNKYFPIVAAWEIPTSALDASIAEMARDGIRGNEGVALWLGTRSTTCVRVTHVVCLRGAGVVREPDHLHIEAAVLNDVADLAIAHGAALVGQIHSHGPFHGVNLSPTDRRYGFAVPYFLSVVAPDYALRAGISLADCGIHILEPSQGYRRLSPSEVAERVRLAARPASILLAGQEEE